MRHQGMANGSLVGQLTRPFHLQPDLCLQSDNAVQGSSTHEDGGSSE